jgi:folate-binding protein YgfZ
MTTLLDPAATWQAMRSSVVAFELVRDVASVSGPDARSWLQGQLSQDVLGIERGEAVDSLLLGPEGRIVALVRVSAPGEDELWMDCEQGLGEAVIERLRRFKLRVKADLTSFECRGLALRGPRAGEVAARAGEAADLSALPWRWSGDDGWDLLGPSVVLPEDVPLGSDEAAAAARIAAGIPRHGRELTDRTIPHEVGVVERAVSFTKGCYTGQELVARLDSRGARTPRRLRGVVFPDFAAASGSPEAGTELRSAGKVVGELTSVAMSPATGSPIALALVRREVDPPADCETDCGPAVVEQLPMLSSGPLGTSSG